jgi:hypothetical protein
MAWEVYTRDRITPGDPHVTITKMGRLALNKAATAKLQKQKVEHVLLLWDKDSAKVGVQPSKKVPGSYFVTYGDNGNGAGFSCVTFLNYIKYDWSETHNFPANWDAAEGMFVFDIPNEHLGFEGKVRRSDRTKSEPELFDGQEKEASEETS